MTPVRFIQLLAQAGWKTQRKTTPLQLPPHLFSRYPLLPPIWLKFMEQIDRCTNPQDTAWFLTEADFHNADANAYRWNEFEMMSLEAAENDTKLDSQIRHFWNRHLPILISVKSGYMYLALRVDGRTPSVVYGTEPEFEDASPLVDSLEEFFDLFLNHVSGRQRLKPLGLLV